MRVNQIWTYAYPWKAKTKRMTTRWGRFTKTGYFYLRECFKYRLDYQFLSTFIFLLARWFFYPWERKCHRFSICNNSIHLRTIPLLLYLNQRLIVCFAKVNLTQGDKASNGLEQKLFSLLLNPTSFHTLKYRIRANLTAFDTKMSLAHFAKNSVYFPFT